MDLRNLTFPESHFNVIWDNATFIHIPNESVQTVMSGYYRVLDENGLLFLRVKKGNGETEMDTLEYDEGETRFFKLYKKEEIKLLVEKCGFKIVEIGEQQAVDGRPINWI